MGRAVCVSKSFVRHPQNVYQSFILPCPAYLECVMNIDLYIFRNSADRYDQQNIEKIFYPSGDRQHP